VHRAENYQDEHPDTAAVAAGAASTTLVDEMRRAEAAGVMKRAMKVAGATPAALDDEALRRVADTTRTSTGHNGHSGARGRLRGYAFEVMDRGAIAAAGDGREITERVRANNPVFDGSFIKDGEFRGGVQMKSSANGVDAAVAKIEAHKPGTASKAWLHVPADEYDEALRRARGRIRVVKSDVTTSQLDRTVGDGLDELARRGHAATSTKGAAVRGAGKAAAQGAAVGGALDAKALVAGQMSRGEFAQRRARDAAGATLGAGTGAGVERLAATKVAGSAFKHGATRSAAVSVAVASVREVPALARGEISGRDFVENRGLDGAEAAVGAAVGGAAAAAALGSTAGGAAVAALGTVGVVAAGPAIVGGAAVVGSGLVVGAAFRPVRRAVRRRQQQRRGPGNPPALPPASD
jgi:hypothetical protein